MIRLPPPRNWEPGGPRAGLAEARVVLITPSRREGSGGRRGWRVRSGTARPRAKRRPGRRARSHKEAHAPRVQPPGLSGGRGGRPAPRAAPEPRALRGACGVRGGVKAPGFTLTLLFKPFLRSFTGSYKKGRTQPPFPAQTLTICLTA